MSGKLIKNNARTEKLNRIWFISATGGPEYYYVAGIVSTGIGLS